MGLYRTAIVPVLSNAHGREGGARPEAELVQPTRGRGPGTPHSNAIYRTHVVVNARVRRYG